MTGLLCGVLCCATQRWQQVPVHNQLVAAPLASGFLLMCFCSNLCCSHFSSRTYFTPLSPTANREEALAESVWLVQLHRNLSDPAAAANITALKPAAWDADGAFLSQLLRWREQRIAAIEWELGRLSADWNITAGELAAAGDKVKLSEAGYGGASDASGSSGSDGVILMDFESESEDPWERMLAWMRHNGAVVSWIWNNRREGRLRVGTKDRLG